MSYQTPQASIQAPQVIERASTTEETIEYEFRDIPKMIEIARCESTFRQYDETGHVLKGIENQYDEGAFQINIQAHPDAIGIIHTLEGNIGYARRLYIEQGTAPWESSRPCWDRAA